MGRTCRLLVGLAVLGGVLPAPRVSAQAPGRAGAPPAQASYGPGLPNPLPDLPRPPDEPRSLYAPPGGPAYTCDPLPGPYFERDPRLDPPELPQPGWFGEVEVGIVGAHVKNRLFEDIPFANGTTGFVRLPSAELEWTASPRVEVGYRLPSGFGGVALSYRGLATDGNGLLTGPVGVAFLKSRLNFNIIDLDYVSRELSLWPHCGMVWRFGLRLNSLYFDSQADAPPAAAAGVGYLESRSTNLFLGIGPHAGVELAQTVEGSGLALVGRIEAASLSGRVRQGFFQEVLGPGGVPVAGITRDANPETAPVINVQGGLGWQPPRYPYTHFFLGYEYEYWWDVGRLSTRLSRGEVSDQGIVLRAEFNF
jgi:hypothetical protein